MSEILKSEITAERYISKEFMQKEMDSVWSKAWLFAGFTQDVREPGDFFLFELEKESIIISRTEEEELKAFYNVCQHRGARLINVESGVMEKYSCPYHGWRYRNDGKLDEVPNEDLFEGGVNCEEYSLKEVRVEDWAGTIWICMDQQAPDFDSFIGDIKELINPYQTKKMLLTEDQTVHLDCNWKAVFDNFGELYHVEHIHPQHQLIFDCPSAKQEYFNNGHTRVLIEGFTVNSELPVPEEVPETMWAQMEALDMDRSSYKGRVRDIRSDIQIKKREYGKLLGYNYDLLSDEQLSDIVQYNIFPNTVLVLQPDEFWILRSRPHETDPNKCLWDKFTLRMPPSKDTNNKANLSLISRAMYQSYFAKECNTEAIIGHVQAYLGNKREGCMAKQVTEVPQALNYLHHERERDTHEMAFVWESALEDLQLKESALFHFLNERAPRYRGKQ